MYRTTEDSPAWLAVQQARDTEFADVVQVTLGRRTVPPAGIITVLHAEKLWQAVLAACEELVPGQRGCMRTSAAYGQDGKTCSAFLRRSNEDGTATSWYVQAHYDPRLRSGMQLHTVVYGPAADSRDAHWEQLLRENHPHVVAGHGWYAFGTTGGGFGGAVFRFRLLDTGQEIMHNDMWYGGTIPPAWRERIPDTAEMIQGQPPAFTI